MLTRNAHCFFVAVTLDEFLQWWTTCDFDDASMAEFGLSV
jgi:hypothetical protein